MHEGFEGSEYQMTTDTKNLFTEPAGRIRYTADTPRRITGLFAQSVAASSQSGAANLEILPGLWNYPLK